MIAIATQSHWNKKVQTMNSVRSKILCLKNKKLSPSDFKDVVIRKFDFFGKDLICLIEIIYKYVSTN